MQMETDPAFVVSGLILLAIFGNEGLRKLSPKAPKTGQKTAVLREILTKETVRDSSGPFMKKVTCPYCNASFVILK